MEGRYIIDNGEGHNVTGQIYTYKEQAEWELEQLVTRPDGTKINVKWAVKELK